MQNWRRKGSMKRWSMHEVEHGTFSPVVFSCTGGMGPLAIVVCILINWVGR